MNPWQVTQQLKYLLLEAEWPDGDQDEVFGDVKITAQAEPEVYGLLRLPLVIVGVGEASAYNSQPYAYTQTFPIQVIHRVEGDREGESAVIGGARFDGVGGSAGRGILEIEEEFLKAVGRLTPVEGIRAACQWRSAVRAGTLEGMGHIVMRNYRISVPCTVERYYHSPANLAKSGDTVSWVLPPTRWDTRRIVLRRASGSTPPASPTAGTGVTLASDLATSVSDATTGAWAYAAFATYDETGSASDERWSEAASDVPGTTLLVT